MENSTINWKDKRSKRKTVQDEPSLNLPENYTWKILSALVDDLSEHLHEDDAEMVRFIIRSKDFESYLCLSKIWGLHSINTQNVLTLSEAKARYTLASLLKKFQFPSDAELRKSRALKKFLAAEETCREFNKVGYKKLIADGEETALFLTYARSFLKKLLGEVCPTLSQVMDSSRHGPGSNLDTQDGKTSAYFKYASWPYSCTPAAVPVARFMIQSNKRWLGALEEDYRRRLGIPATHILNQELFWSLVITEVSHNRIGYVEKDALIDRTIAVEPSLNVMLQLGVEDHIRKRLKRWGIDLDDQTKNQRFAKRGSVTGEFATLDLVGASECIALMLNKLLLPEDWYTYLMKLRSPLGKLGDRKIKYEKISSMGNGYTFALESAIFAAIIYAVQKLTKKGGEKDEFCVFGDDLIVRTEYVKPVIHYLAKCGFSINIDKSFVEGPIRESCGTDWYLGINCRPVFLTRTPTVTSDLWNDINRIQRNLDLQFGIRESNTVKLMCSWIPSLYRDITGPLSNDCFDSYLHVRSFKGARYNNGAWEYTRLVFKPRKVPDCNKFLFRKLMHNLKPGESGRLLFIENRERAKRLRNCGDRKSVV